MYRLTAQRSVRWLLAYGILATVVTAWTPASAGTVAVDFSVLGDLTLDITTSTGAPLTVSGVTFVYDNFGTGAFASADRVGIYGNPNNGVLDLRFSAPSIYAMSFIYGNFGGTGEISPIADALLAIFSRGGAITDAVAESGYLNQYATFNYQGPIFDQVDLYFSLSATIFTADTFTYTPEPMSLALLGIGLAGLAAVRRKYA